MTGHQDHAATGKTLRGDPTYAIDIPALCRAIGVKNVVEVNARDIQAVEKAVKEEIAKDEVSVIITKTPCVLLDKSKKPLYQTHTDKCKKCGMCMKPGCPAMTKMLTEQCPSMIRCVLDADFVQACVNSMRLS